MCILLDVVLMEGDTIYNNLIRTVLDDISIVSQYSTTMASFEYSIFEDSEESSQIRLDSSRHCSRLCRMLLSLWFPSWRFSECLTSFILFSFDLSSLH